MTFEYGIASGDVTAESVVLWTRAPGGAVVDWRVCDGDGDELTAGRATASAEGFVHVGVTGLMPDRRYRYDFSCDGTRSPEGAFRTLPVTGPVRFAVVSCAKYNSGYFNAYAALAARDDLHFVLHLGDYIYEAAQIPRGRQTPGADIDRAFDPPHECVSLDDYMRRYAQYRGDEDLLALHRRHALIATIDDHEIADNAWAGGAEDHSADDGPWPDRWRAAMTAWESWLPTLRRPVSGQPLWMIQDVSDVAGLVVCDSRTHRTDPRGADSEAKTVLGAVQRDEVVAAAREGRWPWLVVMMPSKLLSLDAAIAHEANHRALLGLKLMEEIGEAGPEAYHDRWDAYATERDGLLDELAASASAPVVLCGDVHFAAHSTMFRGEGRIVECVTSSVTSPNLDDKFGLSGGTRDLADLLIDSVPEMGWCDLDGHGFLIVEVGPEEFSCEWWNVARVLERDPSATMVQRVRFARKACDTPVG